MFQYRSTFRAKYDQYAEKHGQSFTVVRAITEPEDDIDAECLPMFEIQFDTGEKALAWPEEVLLG